PYGDGLNQRDWLYVEDHCAAVGLVLEKGEVGEIYNIGAGNETPNRVLVDKLLAIFGVGEERVDYVPDRPGHDRRYSVNIDKVTALGWRKKHTLDEALEATVERYRNNERWWRPPKERAGLWRRGEGPRHRCRWPARPRPARPLRRAGRRRRRRHPRRPGRRRPRPGVPGDHVRAPRRRRARGGVDGGRRLRGRPRAGLPGERPRHPVGGRRQS